MKKLQEVGKIARGVFALFAVIAAVSAYGRTVSVSSVERDSCNRIVRANLHLTTGDTAVLHIAWGSADGGSDIDAWDHHRPVAMVEGTTTSYAYAFPSDIGDDIAAVRFFLLEDYDIPLAKQYDYVETDGTQFVKTQFTPSGLSAVEMRLSLNSVDSSVALCCARTQGNNTDSFTAFYITGSGWRFDYFAGGQPVAPIAVSDQPYTVRMANNGLFLDGTRISARTSNPDRVSGAPLLLFASYYGDTANAQYKASEKLYSLKAWSNSTDVTSIALDLIPTEHDGEACLYNRIDGAYLKSAVAGHPLEHGNEIAVVRPVVLSQTVSLSGKFGAERTIRVVAKHRSSSTGRLSSLDLAFTSGLDRKLYVAYGARDEGNDITDWPHVRLVGDISGDLTEYTFTVPESLGSDARAMRLFLCDSEYIPGCESVCEGVAVDGVYVATGFTPSTLSIIDMVLSFATVSESQTIFCARKSTADSLTMFYIADKGWRLDYKSDQITSEVTAEIGRKYSLRVTGNGLFVDDASIITPRYFAEFTAGSTMALFVASYGHPESGSYPFKGTFYSLKAQQLSGDPNSVVLDLVSCQKDGNACLYNRVNGDFLNFGGSGTAVPVGSKANGFAVATTDAFALYPLGFTISFR